MPEIDPKVGTWLNFIALVLTGLATGLVHWTDLVDPTVAKYITVSMLGIAFIINTLLHGVSNSKQGPLARWVNNGNGGTSNE